MKIPCAVVYLDNNLFLCIYACVYFLNPFIEVAGFSCTGRYAAPEVYKNEEYDTKVDVFSFSLILQEVKFL